MVSSKLSGAFYTPSALAEWMVFHLTNSDSLEKIINVLEPSCGNGIFVNVLDSSNISIKNLDVVELDSDAIQSVKKPNKKIKLTSYNEDFLNWYSTKTYSLVIGNPPYIVKKRLSLEKADRCRAIHIEHNLLDRKIANIWTAFVLKSCDYLSDTGVMAFVLPTEILQVKYAEEIRSYLSDNFPRLEIITFKKLAFENIEQDTVVLFAYKSLKGKSPGVYISDVDGVDQLKNIIPIFTHLPQSSLEQKWTTGILAEEDILLVDYLSMQVRKSRDYCVSVAGIVTGANNYFITNESTKEKFKLSKYSKKIIKKGFYVNGCIDFTEENFESLTNRDVPCFLLDTNDKNNFSEDLRSYLLDGVNQKIPLRFKCKLRKRWHDVPCIKKGEAFFFKRSHDYPKCIKNSADVYVTDSAYQIRMKEMFSIENFIFSFYNSLTLLAAEMQGRYYGGGVLELTPNEFKNLPIPYSTCEDFSEFSKKFETKTAIEEVLEINDQKILIENMGISIKEVKRIQLAYQKMKNRRMRAN